MLALNKLPMLFHPLFSSKSFERAMDDGFFVSVEAADAKFDVTNTQNFLTEIGGKNVEVIYDE
jgi:hypothetical protein